MSGKRSVSTAAKAAAVAGVLAGALAVVGCGGKQNPTMEPTVDQANDSPRTPGDDERRERLTQAVQEFAAARKGLQGHADESSRRQLAGAMGQLTEVLTLLKGQYQDGAFRQQIRIIDRARTQLTGDSATAPEPTINAALRAAQSALDDMAREQFAEDEKVKGSMDALRPRVDGLAGVRGPIHGFETARAIDALGAAVESMSAAAQQRFQQAATAPAVAPAAANPQ